MLYKKKKGGGGGLLHLRKISTVSACADTGRNFSSSLFFLRVKGPFFNMVDSVSWQKWIFMDP